MKNRLTGTKKSGASGRNFFSRALSRSLSFLSVNILLALLLITLASLTAYRVEAGDIYLTSDTSKLPWSGSCAASTCTDSSPCSPKSSVNWDVVDCNITFKNGDYSSWSVLQWVQNADRLVRIQFEDNVRNLPLIITSNGHIVFTSASRVTRGALYDSVIAYSISAPTTSSMGATVSGIDLYNSNVYIGPAPNPTGVVNVRLNISDCTFVSNVGASRYAVTFRNTAAPSSLVIDRTVFRRTTPIATIALSRDYPASSVTITNSHFETNSSLIDAYKTTYLQFSNTTASFVNTSSLVKGPLLFDFGTMPISTDIFSFTNCTIDAVNAGDGGKPRLFPVGNELPTLSFIDSTLSGFTMNSFGTSSTIGTPITIVNTTISGGAEFTLSLPFLISDTYVDLSQPGSYFKMATPTTLTGHASNLTIFSGAETPSEPTFSGNVELDSGSTLTIDKLFLGGGSNVLLPNLNVTTLVSGDGVIACSTTRLAETDGYWSVASIILQIAVKFNVTNVRMLEYHSTQQYRGIESWESSQVLGVPEMISVLWRPISGELPTPEVRYKVMEVLTPPGEEGAPVPGFNDPAQSDYKFLLEYLSAVTIAFYLPAEPTSPPEDPPAPPPIAPPEDPPEEPPAPTPIAPPEEPPAPTPIAPPEEPPIYPPAPTPIAPPEEPPIYEPVSPPIDEEPFEPSPPPIACHGPAPTGFVCEAGRYIMRGNVNQTTLILPPNSGVITVVGNLTVSDPIAFEGTGTSLNVTGCVQSPNGVEFDLSQVDPNSVDKNTKHTVLTQSAGCSNSLTSMIISTKKTKDCKKVEAKKSDASTQATLMVFISVDRSKCNTKWIILGATLGAVFVIAIIVALAFTFSSRLRRTVRPYSK